MPRMNSRTDAICAAGGVPGSVNGAYYPRTSYGRGAFKDDDTIILALGADGGALYEWRWREDPAGAAMAMVEPRRAANFFAGGGGRWAAVGELPDRTPLQFGSLGDKIGAGAADVALDGTVVYKTLYFSDWGLTVVPPSGQPTVIPEAYPLGYQALPGGRAIWPGGAHGRARVRPFYQKAWYVRMATGGDGADWLCYWIDDVGLVLQVDGESEGYVLETRPVAYDHDIVPTEDGVCVCWSWTLGEGPGDLVKLRASRAGVRFVVDPEGAARRVPEWRSFVVPVVIPSFSFGHQVTVAVFKDPDGVTAAPAEILVNGNDQRSARPVIVASDTLGRSWRGPLLGVYDEAADPAAALSLARQRKTRLFLTWDKKEPWALPPGLRPWDVPMIEMYRYEGETLAAALARWRRDARSMLQLWRGDCGVVPMFYCMGGAAGGSPPELWPIGAVTETLAYLSEIVNLSPRIKVVAPFSYLRANGIVAHGELQRAYDNLLAAAPIPAALTPVDVTPPPPLPPPPPPPPKPKDLYNTAKEYTMSTQTETGYVKGPGNKFGRVAEADKGKGPFGWYPVLFDREQPDEDCEFVLSRPDSRHAVRHARVDGLLGADATEHSADIPRQFYLKPGDDRGILESPVVIHDPASALIVGFFTWPDKGVSGPAFTWVKK
jgi:hypothetical protein